MDYLNVLKSSVVDMIPPNLIGVIRFMCINFGIYLLWILMHYIASHLYVHWCVPATIMGLIMSPFMVPAPHCYGLRWIIYQGGNSIIVMWSFIGVWLIGRILPIKND